MMRSNLPSSSSTVEREGRPFVDLGFRPDPAAMPLNDALHRSETNTRALKLFHLVQSLEYTEQFAGVSLIKTGAVVADEQDRFPTYNLVANLDNRALFAPGIFDCIRQ